MVRISLCAFALTLLACGGSSSSTGPKALDYGSCTESANASKASFVSAHGMADARQLDPKVVEWSFADDGYWVIWHGEVSQCDEEHKTP